MVLLLAYNRLRVYASVTTHFNLSTQKKSSKLIRPNNERLGVTVWPVIKSKQADTFVENRTSRFRVFEWKGRNESKNKHCHAPPKTTTFMPFLWAPLFIWKFLSYVKKRGPSTFHIIDGFVVYFFINICYNNLTKDM